MPPRRSPVFRAPRSRVSSAPIRNFQDLVHWIYLLEIDSEVGSQLPRYGKPFGNRIDVEPCACRGAKSDGPLGKNDYCIPNLAFLGEKPVVYKPLYVQRHRQNMRHFMRRIERIDIDEHATGNESAEWRAANYLSVGQIYLQENPLLESPLRLEHIKPRLLGHWGTTPGLNFLYVHLNRLIKENDLNMMYVIGPGHGGPGVVAQTYLEGSYTEHYPAIERSRNGLHRLFRQFSWPYGIPSHVSPETPGSIHEGGELGYSLAHAYGAAFDNPDLIVACIIGDGEARVPGARIKSRSLISRTPNI
jgi:hypothetical protein